MSPQLFKKNSYVSLEKLIHDFNDFQPADPSQCTTPPATKANKELSRIAKACRFEFNNPNQISDVEMQYYHIYHALKAIHNPEIDPDMSSNPTDFHNPPSPTRKPVLFNPHNSQQEHIVYLDLEPDPDPELEAINNQHYDEFISSFLT